MTRDYTIVYIKGRIKLPDRMYMLQFTIKFSIPDYASSKTRIHSANIETKSNYYLKFSQEHNVKRI